MSEALQALTDELCALTASWDNNRLTTNDERKKARAIGEKLHKLGGLDAMREAYYAAKAQNRAAMSVQAAWDRVGQWRW